MYFVLAKISEWRQPILFTDICICGVKFPPCVEICVGLVPICLFINQLSQKSQMRTSWTLYMLTALRPPEKVCESIWMGRLEWKTCSGLRNFHRDPEKNLFQIWETKIAKKLTPVTGKNFSHVQIACSSLQVYMWIVGQFFWPPRVSFGFWFPSLFFLFGNASWATLFCMLTPMFKR